MGRVVSSLIYKGIDRLAVKGMGFIVSVMLARLLSPSDFGQIAIIMVFINLSYVFIESGLSSALVQNKKTSIDDYSTVFYISITIAIILILVIHFLAPYISAFYNDYALILPLRVYSFSLLFGALNSILTAKLQKEMKFRATMICNISATLIAGIIGIVMAYLNIGIWALVTYFFSATVISSISMLIAAKWYPKLTYSKIRAKELFSYGWKMMVSGLACSLYYDIRTLIIGKIHTAQDLGFYNRGEQMPSILASTLDNSIQSVMFPVIAEVQDDSLRVKNILRKTICLGTLLIIPVMAGLATIAEPLITILLTTKWVECVPYMQILCIGYAALPLTSSNLVAIKSIGRSDIYMRLEIVRRIVMIAILLISVFCFDSIIAIAIGATISHWVDYIITTIPVRRLVKYGFIEQLSDIWKVIIASILMGGITLIVGEIQLPIIFVLTIQIIIAIISYIVLCRLLKIEAFNDLIFIFLHNIKRK